VWVLALGAVVWLVCLGLLGEQQAVLARHRACTAADLAALAGAAAVTGEPGQLASACSVAADIARANGAELKSCSVASEVIDVTVAVPVRGQFSSIVSPATARARAGPAP
jgi:secretion/DNA translocation related TadE-like protein